ncbi:MAG: hypothetical protein Ct9H300mP25_04750 [Acidobacteriota bacterium]|nr:MAG: hypothetical protein Ct9H300mP25_04750 [Acidobacteriota bacterium]
MIRIGLSRLATTSLVFLTCSLWVSAQESTAEFDPPRPNGVILIFAVITFRDSIGHWKSLQTRTGNRRQRVPGETMRLFHGFLSQIRMRLQGLPDLQRR